MPKRSFFFKNYLAHAVLILLALSLCGAVFIHQVNVYARNEKQSLLKSTALSVAEQAAVMANVESSTLNEIFLLSLRQTAKEEGISILITDAYGNIAIWADRDGLAVVSAIRVDSFAAQRVRRGGVYSDVGTLSVLDQPSYVVGTQSLKQNGEVAALVFVACSRDAVNAVIDQISRMFFLIVLLTMFGLLFVTYFISMRMTQPLKTMVSAAKEFASGNFAVRVPEDNHCEEIDELAASFNNMAHDLEQLEELTRGFIGNVSHEFKTPMTTIGGFVDGMIDGTIPQSQYDKYLKIISEEVKRLSRMVIRMLDAAKIQSGELIMNPAPFDFSEMASQILFSFEKQIENKQLSVDAAFEDRLMANGDRDHIFRAVYNLMDNAVKFIDQGGKLTIRAEEADGRCLFSVKNTGAGIPSEEIPHVFDRFYKTDRSRGLDKTGAGLGLYIVKNIINLHGGEVSVRSDVGETEFSFDLPLVNPVHRV